jgi:uncharacterized protein
MLTTEIFFRISKEVGASVPRVEATVKLLEGGATIPFIARYRKEATGNLDETRIENIEECRLYYTALEQRRQQILASLESQGKLSGELKQKIQECYSRAELEDLYLPYRPKKKTKANEALRLGLGPLADYIWEQTGLDPVGVIAERFVSPPEPELPVPVGAAPAQAVTPAPPVEEAAAEHESDPQPTAVSGPCPELVQGADAGPDAGPDTGTDAGTVTGTDAGTVTGTMDAAPPPEAAAESPESGDKKEAPSPSAPSPKPEPKRRINNIEEAIDGALHILAERVAENAEFRKHLRDKLMHEGVIRSSVVAGKESEKTKYEMYYKFEEVVPKIPSHRLLAIRRGARENVLTYTIDTDNEKFVAVLQPQVIRDSGSQFAPFLERAIRDGYERLMLPSIRNEVRTILKERAEAEAIRVFEDNLRTLLLSPPAGPIGVIGVDPGIRTGCKVAVVDGSGKFIESQVLQLSDPNKDLEGAEKILTDLIQKHEARGITIGNGTGSREAELFARSVVQKSGLKVFIAVVNESGASVYSASRRAREEFPDLDVIVRGAISIARRLQDPLAELVKIEPRSIGVGQYQHDVDQKKLKKSLEAAVGSCVNRVGVDLNTASEDLLKYVSGINAKIAANIVARRQQGGPFQSRNQLREIEGFGDKTFEQAAGFLRIRDGSDPLDRTGVHPESYSIVEKIAASLGAAVADLIGNTERVNSVDFRALEADAGRFTLSDIREELLRPGRDPRDKFVAPKFRDDVKEIVDLKEGMELEGRISNVTNFGAFVDLGVHQDGLVHISELSHKFVQDAREAVKVGDVVKVKVIGVDSTMKRISLSMKALIPKPVRPPRHRKAKPQQQAAVAQAARPAGERTAAPPPGDRKPRRDQAPRPPRPQAGQETRPPRPSRPQKPVEVTKPAPALTMDEMIAALQAKFSGMK